MIRAGKIAFSLMHIARVLLTRFVILIILCYCLPYYHRYFYLCLSCTFGFQFSDNQLNMFKFLSSRLFSVVYLLKLLELVELKLKEVISREPTLLVMVVGVPNVGKSALINSIHQIASSRFPGMLFS